MSQDEIDEVLRHAAGWPGMVRARSILSLRDGRSESVGESVARLRFHQWGLPAPDLQHVFHIDGHTDRVDFYWPQFGVVCEFDGFVKYGDGEEGRRALWREKQREDRIRREVKAFIRCVWSELWDRNGSLPARLAAVLR